MEFFVYSRDAVGAIQPHVESHIIVSISTPGDVEARLPLCKSTLGVVRLWFSDICDDALELIYKRNLDVESEADVASRIFNTSHAHQILNLVKAHPNAEHFIVHCDAGWSRSPAVAAAISRIVHDDDSHFFQRYRPNNRVYRMLLEEHAVMQKA